MSSFIHTIFILLSTRLLSVLAVTRVNWSNEELLSYIKELDERTTGLEALCHQQQQEINVLKEENEDLYEITRLLNQHFAFSAYANIHSEYEIGDKIEFAGVITNIGNYYDPEQSHFNCPLSGTYYFAINMQSMTNGYMLRAELVKNDIMIANAEIYDVETYAHMSSNSAIVSCAQGERVWVRAGVRSEVHGEEEPYTTFVGFLIELD